MSKDINRHSADWLSLRRYNNERIAHHRAELEGLNVTETRAHQLRGMIFALQAQIEHVEPSSDPEVREPNYG